MREILFRGKRVDNGEWVIGYLVRGEDYLYETEITTIFSTDTIFFPHTETSGYDRVITDTVGQFTGVYDKNGNKIFEGDIVCTGNTNGEICSLGDVKFECGTFGVEWTVNKKNKWLVGVWGQRHNLRRFDDGIGDDIVVIGNIHDNPELLEIEK